MGVHRQEFISQDVSDESANTNSSRSHPVCPRQWAQTPHSLSVLGRSFLPFCSPQSHSKLSHSMKISAKEQSSIA